MNLKLSNQTIELDTQKLTEEDKKKLIEALEDNIWPKKGDEYFYIETSYHSPVGGYRWNGDQVDKNNMAIGNVFRTEQEAEKHLTYLKALQVLKGDTKGYEYIVGDNYISVSWNTHTKIFDQIELSVDVWEGLKFKTEEDAESSIKLHEKEWRIVLLGEDK